MSTSSVTITGAVEFLKVELQRRQSQVDEAFAALDDACNGLDEIRALLAGIGCNADADIAPPTDHRRGPKGNMVTWNDQTLSIWQWSQITGIRANTIYLRLKRGWSAERALTEKEHEKAVPVKAAAAPPPVKATPAPPDPPAPVPIPPPVVEPKVTWPDVVATSTAKPEPPAEPDGCDDGDDGDDDDPSGKRAASVDALKAEVQRQQQGQKGKSAILATTTHRGKGDNCHAHKAKVDHFGDGYTLPDEHGHSHRVTKFLVGRAHNHAHDLAIP